MLQRTISPVYVLAAIYMFCIMGPAFGFIADYAVCVLLIVKGRTMTYSFYINFCVVWSLVDSCVI